MHTRRQKVDVASSIAPAPFFIRYCRGANCNDVVVCRRKSPSTCSPVSHCGDNDDSDDGDRYGNEPRVSYYEVPVVVDNAMGAVLSGSDYMQTATEKELA